MANLASFILTWPISGTTDHQGARRPGRSHNYNIRKRRTSVLFKSRSQSIKHEDQLHDSTGSASQDEHHDLEDPPCCALCEQFQQVCRISSSTTPSCGAPKKISELQWLYSGYFIVACAKQHLAFVTRS